MTSSVVVCSRFFTEISNNSPDLYNPENSEIAKKLTGLSHKLDRMTVPEYARLRDIESIELGALLGRGGFSEVLEVRKYFGTESSPPLAMKRINPKLYQTNPSKVYLGIEDMVHEIRFLFHLKHENIVKIYAFSSNPMESIFHFSMVLERMDATVNNWIDGSELEPENIARVKALLDVCSALRFLHDKRILHRDIKPENVGLVKEMDVFKAKIFDFGLARCLEKYIPNDDGCYSLGYAGTKRYMAPEVHLRKPYNLTSDVYSFGILMWAVMSLKKPYADRPKDCLKKRIVKNNERPPTRKVPIESLRKLMKESWQENLQNRPSMVYLHTELIKVHGQLRSTEGTQN